MNHLSSPQAPIPISSKTGRHSCTRLATKPELLLLYTDTPGFTAVFCRDTTRDSHPTSEQTSTTQVCVCECARVQDVARQQGLPEPSITKVLSRVAVPKADVGSGLGSSSVGEFMLSMPKGPRQIPRTKTIQNKPQYLYTHTHTLISTQLFPCFCFTAS